MSTSAFLVSTLLALLSYIAYRIWKRLHHWQLEGIPCETPHIILGNLTGLRTNRSISQIWTDYYGKFKGTGPFAGFYWFHSPGVFVLDTELAKNILIKDFSKFTDRGFFSNEDNDPLTGQLFLLDGHKWRNMRNKLSPTFTSGKMKHMCPTVIKIGEEFAEVFGEAVEKESIVEVKDFCARYATDVIGTCAFGLELSSLKNPDDEFRKMGQRVFTDHRGNQLHLLIVSSFPELARILGLKQTPDHIEKFFLGIVRDTVEQREKHNIQRNDFMDLLLQLKNNKMMKSEDGETLTNLTFNEVAAQAYVFLIAGFETSSTTMGFALYELAQNEDIQQRLRDEINSVLDHHNGEFSYECFKDMTYLDQVISETLRLHTVLPVLNRKCLEDYVVPGHPNYVIKKGMPILIPAGAIHRDADYYPDPNTFNPENFSPEAVKQRDSVLWLPFGDGPRNCIGMRFGQMQTRIGLAVLIKNFKFSVCEKTEIPLTLNKKTYLISSEGGIYLQVEKV